jgi:hypothetical protein
MNRSRARMATYAPGALILLALIVGGSAEPSLLTDAFIQIATILICGGILLTKRSTRIDPTLLIFPLFLLLIIVVQLVPFPFNWIREFWPSAVLAAWDVSDDKRSVGFLTLNVQGTLRVLGYASTCSIFLWMLASQSRKQLLGMLPFIFVGILANAFALMLEVSFNFSGPISNVFFYPIWAGFFANPNHLATLLAMAAPPLVFIMLHKSKLLGGAALTVVLILELADGSRAGIGISFVVTGISVFMLGGWHSRRPLFSILPLITFAGLGFAAWQNVTLKGPDVNAGRLEFLNTSLMSIRESPVFGTGYGTFVETYQVYEKLADIYTEYVNHAHDDYLELLVEGGSLAAVAMALYLGLLFARSVRHRHDLSARVAFLSILVVLMHSAVDYPLRTMAVQYLFIFAHAILFNAHPEQVELAGERLQDKP